MMAMRGPEPSAADVTAPGALAVPPASVATTTPAAPSPVRPQIDLLLDQGLEALARGEVDAALAHYRAAVIADPTRAEAQRGRGIAAVRAGLDDEAIAAYESYLALAPDASDAERIRDRLTAARARRSARLTSTADSRARRGQR
jgi:regulator of sirC expression with transglutaminase-like and TPR domain